MMDLIEVLLWALLIGVSLLETVFPILFTKMIADAASFLRKSEKEKYEKLRDYVKVVKRLFYLLIVLFVLYAVKVLVFYFTDSLNNYDLYPLFPFVPECILAGIAFNKHNKAAALYRNIFPPMPSRNAYNAKTKAAGRTDAVSGSAPAVSGEEWNKLFGEEGGSKKEDINENLDIAKEADKELLNYLKSEDGSTENDSPDTINENLDIRKLPDSELMEYLKGGEKPAEPTVPVVNKQTGGEKLNICPACGYLNFEGNEQCDFCGAELK